MTIELGIAFFLSLLIIFAAIARGAHDLWAALIVYATTAVVGLILLIHRYRSSTKKLQFPLLIPILILLGVFTASFFGASNPAESRIELMDWVCAILIFYISVQTFQSSTMPAFFFRCVIPALWLEAVAVLFQKIGDSFRPQFNAMLSSPGIWNYLLYNDHIFDIEKMGTLVNPNILAAFVLPLLFALSWQVVVDLRNGNRKVAAYEISGIAAGFVCLVLVRSSAAWICLLLALIASMWQFRDHPVLLRRKKALLFLFTSAVVVIGLMVISKFIGSIDRLTDPLRNNSNRVYWWRSAIGMFMDHPWRGIGLGNFASAYLTYKVGGTENTVYAHSFPLTVLAETGLVGLGALIGLIVVAYEKILKKSPSFFSEQSLILTLSMMGIFYSFNIGLEYLVNLIMMAIVAGMIFSNSKAISVKPRWSALILAFVFVVATIPFIGAPFVASRLIVDGQAYIKEKNWDAASRSFSSASELDPHAWEPFAGLAKVSAEKGDYSQAVQNQQKAIDRNRLFLPLKQQLSDYQRFLK